MSARIANARHPQAHALERREAARLLRTARAALRPDALDHAGDAIGLALRAMPASRHARRLKVELLLRLAQHDAAEALIAVSTLHHPNDTSLIIQRARLLLARCRLPEAESAAQRVITARPQCSGPLVLAARIRIAMSDHAGAAALLRRASRLRSRDRMILAALAETLVECGQIEAAAATLRQVHAPSAALLAEVSRAQRRYVDAVEILERAITTTASPAERERLRGELIATVDDMGDWPRLAQLLESEEMGSDPFLHDDLAKSGTFRRDTRLRQKGVRTPLSARAAALISLGFPEQALRWLTSSAAGDAGAATTRLELAAATLAGDHERALAALDERAAADQSIESAPVARLLLRGMFGRTIRDHIEAGRWRAAAGDPSTSVLQPLLREALATLEARLKSLAASDHGNDAERGRLKHARVICLRASGQAWEAIAAQVNDARSARTGVAASRTMTNDPARPGAEHRERRAA